MCIWEKHLFHNDISPHFKFLLSNERLDFCDKKLNKRSKWFNNADKFSWPSLIIFTKGANIFVHDIFVCTSSGFVSSGGLSDLGALSKFQVWGPNTITTGTSKDIEYHEKGQYFLSLISEHETHILYRFITHRVKYFKPLFLAILMIMAYR